MKELGGKTRAEDEPSSEEEFLPLSESSRLSLSDSATYKVAPPPTILVQPPSVEKIPQVSDFETLRVSCSPVLPPLSPRPPPSGEEVSEAEGGREGVFFLERNIDGLPERNLTSPRSGQVSSVRVSVIKPVRPESDKEPVAITVTAPAPVPVPSPSPDSQELLASAQSLVVSSQDEEAAVSQISPRLTRIPTFYEPLLPPPLLSNQQVESIRCLFSNLLDGKLTRANHSLLLTEVEVHPYLSSTLYHACFGPQQSGSCDQFLSFLQNNSRQLLSVSEEVRTFHILAGCSRNFLIPEDFGLLLETFIMTHPQMSHFRECRALHQDFATSVTASLFFKARAWRQKRMSLQQFLLLNLTAILRDLSANIVDINFLDFFSYDQFYVFYHKFVQLDEDQDSHLARPEFLDYEDENGGFVCPLLVERIFQLNINNTADLMTFWDFVIFLLAHINICSPSGLEYWFPVLDADDDGVLSLGDLKKFYEENCICIVTGMMCY